ncbi:MAG: MerR family transcriptional regulator [Devosia sp.]|nr:MerR family transcriptional regulator [Devosia sp.]
MEKSPDAFRTISEAADELNLPQHVLRFWETRFATIRPLKRGGGRRYYRPEDVLLLKGIRHLLYDQGFTIKGVQRILKENGGKHVAAIGDGQAFEPTMFQPLPGEDLGPADPSVDVPIGRFAPTPSVNARAGLETADRERLSGVLRELLDCKRLLERARET